MAPVPLPVPTLNLPFSNIENVVPPAPHDPPSVNDVLLAQKYAQRALTAEQHHGQIDAKTTADALIYADSILAAASGGHAAPPWFAQALRLGLQPIETRLDNIETRLDDITTRLDSIDEKIDKLTIFAVKNYNRGLGDGRPVPFAPVPFPDGTLPAAQNHVALTDVKAIDNLSYDALRAYCEGYYPNRAYGNGQRLQERRQSIRQAIGCTATY